MLSRWSAVAFSLLGLFVLPGSALSQQAMTVTGRVMANGLPVVGASVRVPDIRIESVTDVDGRYSFIIPSASVRGQTVAISARSVRLPTVSLQISLRGGTIVQDFDLTPRTGTVADRPSNEPRPAPVTTPRDSGFEIPPSEHSLSEALIGRFAGLQVAAPATLGGSAVLSYRGTRSVAAASAPIVMLNGVEIDRTQLRDAAARFGFGGLDFDQSFDDINPADVLSIQFLTPLRATERFGGRAANGAVLVETRDGRGINGFQTSFTQRFQHISPVILPEFQNEYGQGSAGLFSFFDGKGEGLNDGLPLSWGPALDGRPLTQASLTEAGRPDVRHWLPRPGSFSGFFEGGQSLLTNASISGGGAKGHLRASLSGMASNGITPGATASRYNASVRGSRQLAAGLVVEGFASGTVAKAANRALTGFDFANPTVSLVRTPRQVDIETLRKSVRDADDQQINWIYTGSNNPYFAVEENSNEDSRRHLTFGAATTWAAASWLSIAGHLGRDAWAGDRDFSIASGWIGGFPTELGRTGFAEGGYQTQGLGARTIAGELTATTTTFRRGNASGAFVFGARRHAHHAERSSVVYDTATVGADTAAQRLAATPVEQDFWSHGTSYFGRVNGAIKALTVSAGASRDQESLFADEHETRVNPFASAAIELGRWAPSFLRADRFSIRAGWGRTTTPLMPNETREVYAGAASPDGIAINGTPVATNASDLTSEVLTTREVGLDMSAVNHRVDMGLTVYADRTSSLILARPQGAEMAATNGGELTNSGVEARITGVLSRGDRREWSITATAAHNVNSIVELPDGLGSIPLGPSRWNVRLEGIPGSPVSTIVGSTFLRDPSGALLLRNGLPIADLTPSGIRSLGAAQPKWFGGLSSAFRYRAIDVAIRADGQLGGRFFSATNRLGATNGTLAETAYRPDSGLVIAGIDSLSGAPNATHVSTESYYRALGDIAERWMYDASFLKLREVRIGTTIALPQAGPFRSPMLHASLFGRNLIAFSRVSNVDPEAALGATGVRGFELGALPIGRTFGIQVTIQP